MSTVKKCSLTLYLAMRTANLRRRQLILLGIKPDRVEPGYGWIEPAGPLCEGSTLLRVARFWEKPPQPLARKLWQGSCFWNSFVNGWYGSGSSHHDL